jgi:hypothetical protein
MNPPGLDPPTRPRVSHRAGGGLSISLFALAAAASLAAATTTAGAANPYAQRYERILQDAQALSQREPTNAVAAWQLARAYFDCAEFGTNDAQRAQIARQGILAAREAVRLGPSLPGSHYYLGLNLGRLADATRSLGGLKLVSEMESEFKKTRELEAVFDYAGADRTLGLLYRDAPGWPISVGSRAKARQHLEQARELAKDYPENQLNLLESWLKWDEQKKAAAELKKAGEVIAAARQKLTGEAWATSWLDWDQRWQNIQKKVTPPEPVRLQFRGRGK